LLNTDGTGQEVIDDSNAPASRLQRAKLENQKQKQAMAEEQKRKISIPPWVWMIAIYVLFNYVLK